MRNPSSSSACSEMGSQALHVKDVRATPPALPACPRRAGLANPWRESTTLMSPCSLWLPLLQLIIRMETAKSAADRDSESAEKLQGDAARLLGQAGAARRRLGAGTTVARMEAAREVAGACSQGPCGCYPGSQGSSSGNPNGGEGRGQGCSSRCFGSCYGCGCCRCCGWGEEEGAASASKGGEERVLEWCGWGCEG